MIKQIYKVNQILINHKNKVLIIQIINKINNKVFCNKIFQQINKFKINQLISNKIYKLINIFKIKQVFRRKNKAFRNKINNKAFNNKINKMQALIDKKIINKI